MNREMDLLEFAVVLMAIGAVILFAIYMCYRYAYVVWYRYGKSGHWSINEIYMRKSSAVKRCIQLKQGNYDARITKYDYVRDSPVPPKD